MATLTPTQFALSYRILDTTLQFDLGALRGVIDEPTFTAKINQGYSELHLNLDHHPDELAYGNLVQVNFPNGLPIGLWKYEGSTTKLDKQNTYEITLMPLASEAQDCDFNGNFTTDTTQPNPPIAPGTFPFTFPISDPTYGAIPFLQTQGHGHLSVATGANQFINDGKSYSYAYNSARVADTLNQAILFGGATWWWFIDSFGVVFLTNISPVTHILTVGRDIDTGEWDNNILATFNVQTVNGAVPPTGTTNITSTITLDQLSEYATSPFLISKIGRRAAQPYSDTSIVDQATCDALATSLLGINAVPVQIWKYHVIGYDTQLIQPGDAVIIRQPNPDPASREPYSEVGPYLVTDTTMYGATYSYDISVSASLTVGGGVAVPVSATSPQLNQENAIYKLIANPQRSGVSPGGGGPGPITQGDYERFGPFQPTTVESPVLGFPLTKPFTILSLIACNESASVANVSLSVGPTSTGPYRLLDNIAIAPNTTYLDDQTSITVAAGDVITAVQPNALLPVTVTISGTVPVS